MRVVSAGTGHGRVDEALARHGITRRKLSTRTLPVSLPESAIHQFWHARLHRDPGCQWLRGVMASTFGTEGASTADSVTQASS